jgi:PAS domain S-box-containing protein
VILLVEDDPGVARLEQLRLERAGFRVAMAATPRAGLQMVASGDIALIVLDQQLTPEMSGLEFFRQVKAAGHDVPAILVTGMQEEGLLLDAMRSGVRDFIPKSPSFLNHLVPAVTRVLDQIKTERELATSRANTRASEKRARELEREIARRKRVQQALHEAEQCLRLMVESIKDVAIFSLDPQGRVVNWNTGAERLFGYAEHEILGQNLAIFYAPEDQADGVPQGDLGVASAAGNATHERWHVRKDGSRFFASGRLSPMFDEQDRLRGFTKFACDITDRKRMEEELKEADQRKDRFLAMLAHELRNPLAPISNAAQILRLEGSRGRNFEWSVKVIEDQVTHMTRMVDDLLDVSRIACGKVVLRNETISLADLVDLALDASRPLIEEYCQNLTVTLPPRPVPLDVDPARMAQVLANLLTNAAKYTDVGGAVSVIGEIVGQEVVIRVRDNGIGISRELLPHVFDMFTQADQTSTRSRGGLGIGLTLVRSLVEMHRGRVSAESDGPGHGSEFTIRLPLPATASHSPADAESPADDSRLHPQRLRILVVDDNRSNAASLGVLLRNLGQEVDTAFDGLSALELARRMHPQVVLLDIGLPGIDGYEIARRCRNEKHFEQTMLVAMTGYGQEEDLRLSREAGFHAHLVKPVKLDDLRLLLDQHWESEHGRS